MKIAYCGRGDEKFWAVIDEAVETVTMMIGGPDDWGPALCDSESIDPYVVRSKRFPIQDITLLPPLQPGSKVVCIGLNYRSHVEALGGKMPSAPMAFIKAPTALIGQGDVIRRSPLTNSLDFEIELVLFIGRGEGRSEGRLLGYTIGNDVSARDLQRKGERGPDLFSGKSLDDTCPVGPWIVTRDELGDNPDLEMRLSVNGELRQHDHTSSMEWGLKVLLQYVNDRTRLVPGDLIFTGTPAGVALEDGRFLEPGDVVETEIEGIGLLRNVVAASL